MSDKKVTFDSLIDDYKSNAKDEFDLSLLTESLDNIPDELYELKNLKKLHLGSCPITKLSTNIVKLTELVELNAGAANFSKFPLVLMKLPFLKALIIRVGSFNEMPIDLDHWDKLEYLYITGVKNTTEINGLPRNLNYLYIGEGGFPGKAEKIFDLKKIKKLVLRDLGLRTIPQAVFQMTSLFALFLGDNKLKSISKKISNLENLTQLTLYTNSFSEFPTAILGCKKLVELDLAKNNLKVLDAGIGDLPLLANLDLSDNDLKEIPDTLRRLTELKTLRFSNIFYLDELKSSNKIKEVPFWINELSKLEQFEIANNPIENIPAEIVLKGIDAIKDFILSKQEAENEDFLFEAKMVVVGRGNVGKTVLTKKLTSPDYILAESLSTQGISILKNPFQFPVTNFHDKNFKFNVWDFGGQEKYDATHQLFITNRSIYLFLTEAREESNYSDFHFWLNTIRLFSNNSPVIVVLSKCDERKKLLPETQYRERFKNIVSFVEVSCKEGFEETIINLKTAIATAIGLLPQISQKLSNRWIDIRNSLEELSKQKDYIEYSEYLEICENGKLNQKQADFLSQYLNDLGVIIHHQHDLLLKKTVFINTDWCVDGIYKVLDDELVYTNKGKFTTLELQSIWSDDKFKNKQEELLKLMKEYDLCFEMRDGSGFIAPDLLPPDKPAEFYWDGSSNLQFEYRYDFMPAGMLSRFIVKSHSFILDNSYWKYGVILKYDDTLALVEEDYIQGKVKISIRGTNRKGLLSAIRMYFEEVHNDFDKANRLSFEEMVPCNCSDCNQRTIPHFYKFNVLKRFESNAVTSTNCEISTKSVQIKSLINDVQIPNPLQNIETNYDLKNFVLKLIDDVLNKEISLKGGFMNFWRDIACTVPKGEVEIQPYISNALDNFCKTRGINLQRETKEANGNVDLMFSYTNENKDLLKVCVEIKKSHHQDVETAIQTQLPEYMRSAGTECGIYLIFWLKNENFKQPAKFESPNELKKAIEMNNPDSGNISVTIIDCNKATSPSRIK
jgi:internalin A